MVDWSAPIIVVGLIFLLLLLSPFLKKELRPNVYVRDNYYPSFVSYPTYDLPYYPYWDVPYYDNWYGSGWWPWNWYSNWGGRWGGRKHHGGRRSSRYSPQYQLARGGGGLTQRGPGWTKAQIKNAGAAWSHARAKLKVRK